MKYYGLSESDKKLLEFSMSVLKFNMKDGLQNKTREHIESLQRQLTHDYGVLEETVSIDDYCEQAFQTAISKGWHDQPRETGTLLALIHAEVSEALEADRKNDDENFAEELADVCIRIFDLCGAKDIDLESAINQKMEKNKDRSYRHGNKKY